jgi:hypothetical protein
VAEERSHEPPEAVAPQADRDEDEQHVPERLVGDRRQSALLVCRLAARSECELHGENSDDPVDHAARDESCPGKPLEAGAVRDPVGAAPGTA